MTRATSSIKMTSNTFRDLVDEKNWLVSLELLIILKRKIILIFTLPILADFATLNSEQRICNEKDINKSKNLYQKIVHDQNAKSPKISEFLKNNGSR